MICVNPRLNNGGNMKRTICLLFIFGFLTLSVMHAGGKSAVDFTDPVKVVQAVFDAAKNKDIVILTTLCDPKEENDGDTRRICELTKDSEKLAEFFKWFSKGKVTGKAVITGDKAAVPFVFGPEGKRKEEMNLVNRDGKWYLSSF